METKEKLKKEVDKLEEEKKKLSLQLAKEKAKSSASKFKNEFNKALYTALMAAFGFIIALVWRDLITEYVNQITTLTPVHGKLIEAFFVTLIAVIGIIIVSGILKSETN